jgi:hypothetical protein
MTFLSIQRQPNDASTDILIYTDFHLENSFEAVLRAQIV